MTSFKKTIWCLFAHPDDEFFVLNRISDYIQAKHQIHCLYTTTGVKIEMDPYQRIKETKTVLSKLGMSPEKIISLGIEENIPLSSCYLSLNKVYEACKKRIETQPPHEIMIPTWEGGHVDHDATHLIGKALSLSFPDVQTVTEFPLYNSFGLPHPFFRVMTFPIKNSAINFRRIPWIQAMKNFLKVRFYSSQWKTFVGLGPGLFFRLVLQRKEPTLNSFGFFRDYTQRPHHGKLFYESRFKVTFQNFLAGTKPFIRTFLS